MRVKDVVEKLQDDTTYRPTEVETEDQGTFEIRYDYDPGAQENYAVLEFTPDYFRVADEAYAESDDDTEASWYGLRVYLLKVEDEAE